MNFIFVCDITSVIQPVNPQLEVLAPQPAVAPIVPPAVDPIVPPAVAPIVQPAVAPIVQPVVAQVVQPAAVEVVPRQQRLVRTRTGRFASKRHRNRVLAQQNPAPWSVSLYQSFNYKIQTLYTTCGTQTNLTMYLSNKIIFIFSSNTLTGAVIIIIFY